MKNFPTHTILIFFLVVSFVLVLLLEFFFADAKELFVGGKKLSDLTTNLCLAYISGYFFYLVTVVLPKRAEREHIKEHAAHLIDRILFHILFIMQDATNSKISQKSLKIESLNIESFRLACKDVFMDNDLSALRASKHGRPLKVGEAVSQNIQELQNTINQIFKYSPYIESELISLISSASRNTLNESWINYNNMVPLHIGNHVLMAVRTDVSGYAECLLEYHTLFRAIETILVKEYKSTIVAQKYIANIAALKAS
jgi:hypothetical protein